MAKLLKYQTPLILPVVLLWVLLFCVISGCKSYDPDLLKEEEKVLSMPEQEGYQAPFDEPWQKSFETHQRTRTELFHRYGVTQGKKPREIQTNYEEITSVVKGISEVSELDGKYLRKAREFYQEDFKSHPRVQKVYRHLRLMYLLLNRALILIVDLEAILTLTQSDSLKTLIRTATTDVTGLLKEFEIPTEEPKSSGWGIWKSGIPKIEEEMGAEVALRGVTYVPLAQVKTQSEGPAGTGPTCELLGPGDYGKYQMSFRIMAPQGVIDGSDSIDEILKNLRTLVEKGVCSPPRPQKCDYLGIGTYKGSKYETSFRLSLGKTVIAGNDRIEDLVGVRKKLEAAGVCAAPTSPLPSCSFTDPGKYGKHYSYLFRISSNGTLMGASHSVDEASKLVKNLMHLGVCSAPIPRPCRYLGPGTVPLSKSEYDYRIQVGETVFSGNDDLDLILTDRMKFEAAGICAPAISTPPPCSLLGTGKRSESGRSTYYFRLSMDGMIVGADDDLEKGILKVLKKLVKNQVCSAPIPKACSLSEGGKFGASKYNYFLRDDTSVLAAFDYFDSLAHATQLLKKTGICQVIPQGSCTLGTSGSFGGTRSWKHTIKLDSETVGGTDSIKDATDLIEKIRSEGFCH